MLSAFDTSNIEYKGTTPDNMHLQILRHILSVGVGGENSTGIWLLELLLDYE